MKTELRLNSVIQNGAGSSPDCGAIELIYSFLLNQNDQNFYSFININQIGDTLSELIRKERKNHIHINIRYPIKNGFNELSIEEKNKFRLDLIHTALLKICEHEGKLNKNKLEAIQNEILSKKFIFYFDIKTYPNNTNKDIVAKVVVHPTADKFEYYFVLEEKNMEKCNVKIFSAGTSLYYFPYYFNACKWKSSNELILTGTKKEVATHIYLDRCAVEHENLTSYKRPPFFTLLKNDLSDVERAQVMEDWNHSKEPWLSGITRRDKEN